MNFLAHLWLADRSATSLAGAVLGDVVRGSDLSAYPVAIAQGIRLHRRIDAWTDCHPQVVAARTGFVAGERRYAGIVIDLVCDYVLAGDWARHSAEAFDAFCRRAAAAVAAEAASFAAAGARAPDAGGFARLLQSYAQADGIDRAVARIGLRLRRPEGFLRAAEGWPALAQRLRPSVPKLLDELGVRVAQALAPDP
ncbi:MAG: ACP phosphodiesterase [Pseudomonadota bacterium]